MKRVGTTFILGLTVAYANACCSVSRSGIPVHFQDQSDIVIWNPETKTEHFVRIANFRSEAESFGFIAPTPSVPELALANGRAFSVLAHTKPQEMSCGCASADAAAKKAAGGVNVLQVKEVGAYHAVTVESKDAAALAKYVQDNGFAMGDDVKAWVKHYVDKGWYLTIFTLGENAGGVDRLDAVRMTFKTEEPFCPFYVPAGNLPKDKGTLQVYFVSNGSYSPNLGQNEAFQKPDWQAALEAEPRKTLSEHLKISESEIPSGAVVSALTYSGFPSGAKEDLFFKRDFVQGYMINGATIGVFGFFGIWGIRKIAQKRRLKAA